MGYRIPLYAGAPCPRCGAYLVRLGRVRRLLRSPCLRCPQCRFTAWRIRSYEDNCRWPVQAGLQRPRIPSRQRRAGFLAATFILVIATGVCVPWSEFNKNDSYTEASETARQVAFPQYRQSQEDRLTRLEPFATVPVPPLDLVFVSLTLKDLSIAPETTDPAPPTRARRSRGLSEVKVSAGLEPPSNVRGPGRRRTATK
jgi:ssDNA-binding Zn-finger/Zn-ribbon topoisomerase 1